MAARGMTPEVTAPAPPSIHREAGTVEAEAPSPVPRHEGDITGVIGGKNKCLATGQQCSVTSTTDLPQYGFVCTPTSPPATWRRSRGHIGHDKSDSYSPVVAGPCA